MKSQMHKVMKTTGALLALVLSLTLASCGGGGGGGGSASGGSPTSPGGGSSQTLGEVSVTLPGRSRSSESVRNASLVPAGAANFLVQVFDMRQRDVVLGFGEADRGEQDTTIKVLNIPAGLVFVKVIARAADRQTVLAVSEDVANITAGVTTSVAAVMGISIREVETNGVRSLRVEPSSFSVSQGDTLVIGNTTSTPVNFTTADPGAKMSTKMGGFSKEFRVITSDPGTYTFKDASGATFTITVAAKSGAITLPLVARVGPLFGRAPHDLTLSAKIQGEGQGVSNGSVVWDFQDGNVTPVSLTTAGTDSITRKTYDSAGTYVVRLCAVETGAISTCPLGENPAGLVRDFKFNVSVDRPAAVVATADYLPWNVGNEWTYQSFDYSMADAGGTTPVRAAAVLDTTSVPVDIPGGATGGPQARVETSRILDAGESKNGFAAKILETITDANRDGQFDSSDQSFHKMYFYVDGSGDMQLYREVDFHVDPSDSTNNENLDLVYDPPLVMAKGSMTEGQAVATKGSFTGTENGQSVSGQFDASFTFVSFHSVGSIAGFFDDAIQIDRKIQYTMNGLTDSDHSIVNLANGVGIVIMTKLEAENGVEAPVEDQVLVHAVVDGLEIGASAPGSEPAGSYFPMLTNGDRWFFNTFEDSVPVDSFDPPAPAARKASQLLARRKSQRAASVTGMKVGRMQVMDVQPTSTGDMHILTQYIEDTNGDVDANGAPVFNEDDGEIDYETFNLNADGIVRIEEKNEKWLKIDKDTPVELVKAHRTVYDPGVPILMEPVTPNLLLESQLAASNEELDPKTGSATSANTTTIEVAYETILVQEPIQLTVGLFENLFAVARVEKEFNANNVQQSQTISFTFYAPGIGPVLAMEEEIHQDGTTGQLVKQSTYNELVSANVGGIDFGIPPSGDGSPYVVGTYPFDGENAFPTFNPQFAVFFSEELVGDYTTASLSFQQLPDFGGITCDPMVDPNCQPPTCDPMVDPTCTPIRKGQSLCDPNVDPNCIPNDNPVITLEGDAVYPIYPADFAPTGKFAGRKLPRGASVTGTGIIGLGFSYAGELPSDKGFLVLDIQVPAGLVGAISSKPLRQPVLPQPIFFFTGQQFQPGTGGVPHAIGQLPGPGGGAPPDGRFAFIYDQVMDTTQLPTQFAFTLDTVDQGGNPVSLSVDQNNFETQDIGHWGWVPDGNLMMLTFFLHGSHMLVNGQNYTLTWNVFPDVYEASLQVPSDTTTYNDVNNVVDFFSGFQPGPGPFAAVGQFPAPGGFMMEGVPLEFFFNNFTDTTKLPTAFSFTLNDNGGNLSIINQDNAANFGFWEWGTGFAGEPKLSFVFTNPVINADGSPYSITWDVFPDVYAADGVTPADFFALAPYVSFDVFPQGAGPGGPPEAVFFHPSDNATVFEYTSIFFGVIGGVDTGHLPNTFAFQVTDKDGNTVVVDPTNAADYGAWEWQYGPNGEAQLHFRMMGPNALMTSAGSPYSLMWLELPDMLAFDPSQVVTNNAIAVGVPVMFNVVAGQPSGPFTANVLEPMEGGTLPVNGAIAIDYSGQPNTGILPDAFQFTLTGNDGSSVTVDQTNAANYGTWQWLPSNFGYKLGFVLNTQTPLLTENVSYQLQWEFFPSVVSFDGQPADYSMFPTPFTINFTAGPAGAPPGSAQAVSFFPNNGTTLMSNAPLEFHFTPGVDMTNTNVAFAFDVDGTAYDQNNFLMAGGNLFWGFDQMGNPVLNIMLPTTPALDPQQSHSITWSLFPQVLDATNNVVDFSQIGTEPYMVTFSVSGGGPGPGPTGILQFPDNGKTIPSNLRGVSFVFPDPMDTTMLPSAYSLTVTDGISSTTYDQNNSSPSWFTNVAGKSGLLIEFGGGFTPSTPYTFNWDVLPQGLVDVNANPIALEGASGVTTNFMVSVVASTLAVGTLPAPGETNVASDGTVFKVVFNNSLQSGSVPSGFDLTITNVGSGNFVTINDANASQFGTFSVGSNHLPDDEIIFQLHACSVLTVNGVPCLQAGTTYSVNMGTIPTNLLDYQNQSIDSSPLTGQQGSSFTTGGGAPPPPSGVSALSIFPAPTDIIGPGSAFEIHYGTGVDTGNTGFAYSFDLDGTPYDQTSFPGSGGTVSWTTDINGNPTLQFIFPGSHPAGGHSMVWNQFPAVTDMSSNPVDYNPIGATPFNVTFSVSGAL